MNNFTLGSDVEVFFVRPDGTPFNLAGKIPATKWKPVRPPNAPFVYSWDNVAFEFAVDYDDDMTVVEQYLNEGLRFAVGLAADFGCVISDRASMLFDEKLLDTPEALIFGCDPDFSAWTGNAMKHKADDHRLRSCGGHLHLGINEMDPKLVGRILDLCLGVPSVLQDHDTERRKLYGRAGAHRPKPYGLEYRVLSNYWMFNDGHWASLQSNLQQAYDMVKRKFDFDKALGSRVMRTINQSDQGEARSLVGEFGLCV